MAARLRIGLAATGTVLLGVEPALHPRPLLAAIGLAILAVTGLVHSLDISQRMLAWEEAVACSAGVLIVTLGTGTVNALTVIWLVSAAVGVIARGGRVGPAGQVLVVAVLASPAIRMGVNVDTVSVLASGCALLLAVGRITLQTNDLLRDPLTGALSHAAFDAQFARLAAHGDPHRPLGVVLIDLDDFSAINRQRGNRSGDAVLISSAETIDAASGGHGLVGRTGGDTFAALILGESPDAVASRILSALGQRGMAASAGTSSSPRDGTEARSLLAAAEVGLRLSKRAGKGRSTGYRGPQLTLGAAPDRAASALDRLCRGDDITIALQPIVDLESRAPAMCEALARFDVRETGEGPMTWFTLADRFGRRRELETTCVRLALEKLDDLAPDCRLTVNVSSDLLGDERLMELLETASQPDRIVVEVTERQAVRAETGFEVAVDRLRERGVAFAVDDVGVGHAGLAQIALVRPEFLKLDRSVVRALPTTPDRMVFARALNRFVAGSGTVVVAEGIETEVELGAVRAAGIELGQGFLLGKPARVSGQPLRV